MPNFSSKNEGVWFFFDTDNESLGGVCLRELNPDEYNRIEKITVKHRKRIMRGVLVDDAQTDDKLASRLRWDYCITAWNNISLDGQVLECTTDNKVKMMNVSDFVKHVADSLGELVETNQSLQEARVKNSESSSNDSSKSRTVKAV